MQQAIEQCALPRLQLRCGRGLKARKVQAIIDQRPVLEARLAAETMARLIGRLEGAAGSIATEIQILMPESV